MNKNTIVKNLLILICSIGLFQKSIAQERAIGEILKKYNNQSIPYIYPKDAVLSDTILYLDAREEAEYNVSKIPGAVYVGFTEFNLGGFALLNIPKSKKIIVYCSLGVRSEKIAQRLKEAGYIYVFNLWGGIFEWINEGKIVVDNNNRATEKIHAYSKKWGKYLKRGSKVYTNNDAE